MYNHDYFNIPWQTGSLSIKTKFTLNKDKKIKVYKLFQICNQTTNKQKNLLVFSLGKLVFNVRNLNLLIIRNNLNHYL